MFIAQRSSLFARCMRYCAYLTRFVDIIGNYYYAGYPKAINPIAHLRTWHMSQAERRIRADTEFCMTIARLHELSGSTGCSYGDYALLYDTVMRHKPRAVLELGSGISSAVIALALSRLYPDGPAPIFVSMEESAGYHEQIKSIFPDALRRFVEFRQSDVVTERYGTFLGIKYRDRPRHDYDFVFIDGPVLSSYDRKTTFNADIMDVIREHREPGRILAVLDNRIPTLRILKKLLPDYLFRYHILTSATIIESRNSGTKESR